MEGALLLKLLILVVCINLLSGYPLQFQQGVYNGANLLSGYQGLLSPYQMSQLANTIPYYSTGGILQNGGTGGKLVRAETATYVPAGSLVMLPSSTRDLPVAIPGTGSVIPGAGSVVPGAGSVIPGAGSVVPGAGSVVPGTGSVIPGTGGLPIGSPICALAGALGNALTNSLCCGATLSLPCLGNGLINNGLLGGLTPGLTPGVGDLQTLLAAYSLLQILGGAGGSLGGLGGGCQCNPGLQIQLPTCCQPTILPIPVPISEAGALPETVGDLPTLPVTNPVTLEDSSSLPVTNPVASGDSPSLPITNPIASEDSPSLPIANAAPPLGTSATTVPITNTAPSGGTSATPVPIASTTPPGGTNATPVPAASTPTNTAGAIVGGLIHK